MRWSETGADAAPQNICECIYLVPQLGFTKRERSLRVLELLDERELVLLFRHVTGDWYLEPPDDWNPQKKRQTSRDELSSVLSNVR